MYRTDGPQREESAQRPGSRLEDPEWKLTQERNEERERVQQEERTRARREELRQSKLAAWKAFLRAEREDLEIGRPANLPGCWAIHYQRSHRRRWHDWSLRTRDRRRKAWWP